jgi:8-oxo-dGTP pyrophosphatase MutT (NUDIX family)
MFPVSVKGVLVTSDGKVVLVFNDRGEWELPGGRIELGESAEECLAREIEEELGLVQRLVSQSTVTCSKSSPDATF